MRTKAWGMLMRIIKSETKVMVKVECEEAYLQRRMRRGCCCGKVKTQAVAFRPLLPLLIPSLQLKHTCFKVIFCPLHVCKCPDKLGYKTFFSGRPCKSIWKGWELNVILLELVVLMPNFLVSCQPGCRI